MFTPYSLTVFSDGERIAHLQLVENKRKPASFPLSEQLVALKTHEEMLNVLKKFRRYDPMLISFYHFHTIKRTEIWDPLDTIIGFFDKKSASPERRSSFSDIKSVPMNSRTLCCQIL